MSLKQSIVVRCDWTNNQHAGHGTTPGKFLTDYVSREDGTEPVYPDNHMLQNGLASFDQHYQQREQATTNATKYHYDREDLTAELMNQDGRAFGNHGLSYDTQQLQDSADTIQQLYDRGHTIQRYVISLKTNYAKQMGILPRDYFHTGHGSLNNQIDELRLRQATTDGMNQMAKRDHFSHPIWTAAIQTDTNHLHVHAVLADDVPLSQSQRMKHLANGHVEEAGNVTDDMKNQFRHTFDRQLAAQLSIPHHHDVVAFNHTNVLTNEHQLVDSQRPAYGQQQAIIDVLPAWHHNVKQPELHRANQLMDRYYDTLVVAHRTPIDTTLSRPQQYQQWYRQQTRPTKPTLYQQATRRSNQQLVQSGPQDKVSQGVLRYRHASTAKHEHLEKSQSMSQLVQQALDQNLSPMLTAFYRQQAQHERDLTDKYRYLTGNNDHPDITKLNHQRDSLLGSPLMHTGTDKLTHQMNAQQYCDAVAQFSEVSFQQGATTGNHVYDGQQLYQQYQQTGQWPVPNQVQEHPVDDQRFNQVCAKDIDTMDDPQVTLGKASDDKVAQFIEDTQQADKVAAPLSGTDNPTVQAVEVQLKRRKKMLEKMMRANQQVTTVENTWDTPGDNQVKHPLDHPGPDRGPSRG